MMFQRPIMELIKTRRSTRTYTGGTIDPAAIKKLEEECMLLKSGPWGEIARFRLVEKPFKKDQPVELGNYGLLKNPRYFFIGAITNGQRARESYGYLMEHLVLKSTELGVGTCWLGYFNREFFVEFITAEDELVPAIVVAGVPAEKPAFGEKMMRMGIRADRRKDWKELFFMCNFEKLLTAEAAGPYAPALEMLRLAPSSGNTQPCRVVKEENAHNYHFFLKKVKQMYYEDGMHNLDIGVAMCHFELLAREARLAGEWRLDDPRLPSLPDATEYRVSWIAK